MADWDTRFIELARHIGQWSKDQSRQVGCVIIGPNNEVRSTGFNGFPRGADETVSSRHLRPTKYLWTEHAERNAIYNAARMGTPLDGCRMYLSWFPCMDCARAIVQVGIVELVALRPNTDDPQWGSDFSAALELFKETKISLRWYEDQQRQP